MSEQILLQDDIRSATWRKVKAWADGELVVLRKQLESDADPYTTAKLRGRIRSLALLLALDKPPAPALEEEDED